MKYLRNAPPPSTLATRRSWIFRYVAIGGFVTGRCCGRPLDYPRCGLCCGGQTAGCGPSGPRWLAEPEVAAVVVKVLREGAAEGRYDLGSWVLMPNHVHVWLKPGDTLPREIAWIKGRTAFEANRVMKRSGSFWAKDYFDRWIRNRNEWERSSRISNKIRSRRGCVNPPKTGNGQVQT